ncbi:hypothetical protein L3Y34_011706 [Caenorhabditis briggsae]|uniref:Uncharacterized protein n=1 Tax=Caenorhabditis briggsae TaxID=6238 RepID=A0AAE8ZQQ7_CAEBR|nr:hypothetical protein L3Y34_011706 [Caenorhabditis briggsae]
MHHTIKTEPNHGYSPPPIRQFLIKEELIDNSYSLSIPENTVEQEVIDEWLSEIYSGMVKNDSFREPIRSLMSETAQMEENFSTGNGYMQYQTQGNLVTPSFNGWYPTQVPELTTKQEFISENLQLTTREEDVQEDNVVEEMYRTIETDPNHEYSLPPLRQTLIKEELIDNSYLFSIPENTVKQNRIDKTLESETCDEICNNEFFRTPLRSFMFDTAQPEEHILTGNVYMQYQNQSNLVTPSCNAFFPTQVSGLTIKQDSISENLQLASREEDAQRDNLVMEMYRTIKTDPNHEHSPSPLLQSLIKKEVIDDSYSFTIPENTVKQGAFDKRLEQKICNGMVKNGYQTQSNPALPSFIGLLSTQIPGMPIKKETNSENRQVALPEKHNEDDNIVGEWDASTELDHLPNSGNSDSEEATVSQEAFTGSTRKSFTQWSSEWDNLIMNEFFNCIRTKRLGFKIIAEAFLKKHEVGISLNTVILCFKRVFKKRLRDPNVPEKEKMKMQKATKSWKMTKRYQEEVLNNRRPIGRIFNTKATSVRTTQWSKSWDKIIMDEFMKIAMNESLDVFSVNKFCEKFKDEHNLATPVSRLVKNFEQAFNERLKDVNVELDSKLKMLLKHKTKVPLELTKQQGRFGTITDNNNEAFSQFLPNTAFVVGFMPLDVSSWSPYTFWLSTRNYLNTVKLYKKFSTSPATV